LGYPEENAAMPLKASLSATPLPGEQNRNHRMTQELLPCVEWNGHKISRLVLGHNPFKGHSHCDKDLNGEMLSWFHPDTGNDLAIMRRAEECGINTVQFGGAPMHDRLQRYAAEGGNLQWIATLYDSGSAWSPDAPSFEEELKQILDVRPAPIGIQNFGENSDRYFITGNMNLLRDKLKRFRDTGLLVGVCTHLPEVVEYIESEGWDVDFYQTCFYTVYSLVNEKRIDRTHEIYDDRARERMVDFIKRASKPCMAFKVLKANRFCDSDEALRGALTFAFDNIKDTDAVCVGMWGKYKDQVAQNAGIVREILGG